MDERKILISYDASGKESAEILSELLSAEGIGSILSDSGSGDGELDGISGSIFAMVLLLSKGNQSLDFVMEEIHFAIREQKVMIPVMLENFELNSNVAPYVSNMQKRFAYNSTPKEAMETVVEDIKRLYERESSSRYSIKSFFKRKLLFETNKAIKVAEAKAEEYSEKRKKIPLSRRITLPVLLVTSLLTFIYIRLGVTKGWRHTNAEISAMTLIPLTLGAVLSLVIGFAAGKIKNKVVIALVTVFSAIAVFVLMMLTGFFISQKI